MLTDTEVTAILERLEFEKSHTTACRNANGIQRWDILKGKRCACPFYSLGIHGQGQRWERKPTHEIVREKARATVEARLKSGNPKAQAGAGAGTPIKTAIDDFMGTVKSKERTASTFAKYKTLMDQLAAFCDHKGYATLQAVTEDAMQEFRDSWSDPEAAYKKGTAWKQNSLATCKRNLKTMRLFFKRGILRKWITADPSVVIAFKPEPSKKSKKDVKYFTAEQMEAIIDAVNDYERMPAYNKLRLKALVLVMRWSGLRISDAIRLRRENFKKDVLFVETKKSKTPVQIPIPAEVMNLLSQLNPYLGGYLFWNRRSDESSISTCEHNFGVLLTDLFVKAGVKEDVRQVSHRFRNSFAVDLLTKGVPLETVSILLGHKSVQTTERFYSDFTSTYLNRAEELVRNAW